MKIYICFTMSLIFECLAGFGQGITAPHMEIKGETLVRDVNRIASFLSSGNNSFIRLASNNNAEIGISLGFYDNPSSLPLPERYFYVDGPGPDFGEFRISFLESSFNNRLSAYDGLLAISASRGVTGNGGESDFYAMHGTYHSPSSIRWKKNIQEITDPLSKISKLRGVSFDWDEAHGGKESIGFIAEEVGRVLPEIVLFEENGTDVKAMDYSKMTPLLLEGIKAIRSEYQEKIYALQSEISELKVVETQINGLKQEIAELKSLITSSRQGEVDNVN
jgi:hypothetical protein